MKLLILYLLYYKVLPMDSQIVFIETILSLFSLTSILFYGFVQLCFVLYDLEVGILYSNLINALLLMLIPLILICNIVIIYILNYYANIKINLDGDQYENNYNDIGEIDYDNLIRFMLKMININFIIMMWLGLFFVINFIIRFNRNIETFTRVDLIHVYAPLYIFFVGIFYHVASKISLRIITFLSYLNKKKE